jgi:type II secretory pathway component GspD/PulD (secretin)
MNPPPKTCQYATTMKASHLLTLSAALWISGSLCAQTETDPLIEPVSAPSADLQAEIPPAESPLNEVIPPAAPEDLPPPSIPPAGNPLPPGTPPPTTPAPGSNFGPLEKQQQEMQKADEGFIIKDAGLNDIFQFLAKSAGRQYFHNSKIAGPEFLVTGHLNDGNPLQQMEELAFMYGLSMHIKGNTIYALTQAQLAQLPSAEFHYQLRYLRPTDIEAIKELIKPMLSPGTGIVNFEPKTNTIIIIDSAHRIEQARELLHGIDQVKGQIIVETKILRINSGAAERVGVNWAASLGELGTPIDVYRSLNSMFGIDNTHSTVGRSSGPWLGAVEASGQGLVLSPFQLNGVLRALAEGDLARQLSNPTLITEDNEQASISIIDRVPILTSTTTPGSGGSPAITTEELRYKIDQSDKSIDTDPEKHREIGISIVVTPTLLPDGTVRMRMRPRSAQISGELVSEATGNRYPRVTESMVESIARVPNGYSLVVGGFYGELDKKDRNKIPILGDIPALNFFFKSKETVKERASLVFIVTPKSYNPTSVGATRSANNQIHSSTAIDCDYDSIDPENPGPAHEPNMKRSVRGLQPEEAPYYPKTQPSFARGKR